MRAEDVRIEAPCGEDWDAMRPEAGAQRRWCDHCERHVHDLSKMSERAARAFLRETATQDVCIAYVHDQAGEIVFAPEPRIVPLARLASAATISMMLSACTPHGEPERAMHVDVPERSMMMTPSSVIPCEAAPPSEPAKPPGEVRKDEPRKHPPRVEHFAVKGKRVIVKGEPCDL